MYYKSDQAKRWTKYTNSLIRRTALADKIFSNVRQLYLLSDSDLKSGLFSWTKSNDDSDWGSHGRFTPTELNTQIVSNDPLYQRIMGLNKECPLTEDDEGSYPQFNKTINLLYSRKMDEQTYTQLTNMADDDLRGYLAKEFHSAVA